MEVVVAGIFVGGAASRMGGRAKGLLVAPSGETIVARFRAMLEARGMPCVLVGPPARTAAYREIGLSVLADAGGIEGPLGGLVALLEHAHGGRAVTVACDMPYVGDGLVDRLLCAPPAPVVAPRREGRWEPFLARWDAAIVLPIARRCAAVGMRSLSRLIDAAGGRELPLSPAEAEELRDWDSPEDAER